MFMFVCVVGCICCVVCCVVCTITNLYYSVSNVMTTSHFLMRRELQKLNGWPSVETGILHKQLFY